MKKTLIVFALLLSVLWTAGAFAEVKEGLWEITSQVEIKGMPETTPPATIRQCITKKDTVPQNKDKNFDCKTTAHNISGNTVTYNVQCKSKEGVMETSGTSTYSDNAMNGTSNTKVKIKGQPEIQMVSKIKGKYLGKCSK